MGDETISSDTKSDAQALTELEEEFERELKRNQLALQLLRERAEEAKIAKSRAELSAQKKECMMNKLKSLQHDMALTNDTLSKAQERIDKQEQIRVMVDNMKGKIKNYEVKLNMQKQNSKQLGMLGEINADFDFPTPLIDYEEEEEKERQTQQNSETQIEPESQKLPDEPQKIEESQQIQDNQEKADHETECPHSDLNESVQRLEAKCAGARSEETLNIDLKESVQRLEAKCGGIREELGQMALSEQYMRTKQAQLRARKKELEAKEATIKAELREKEAADMRVKVEGMMKLLKERKEKLKVTENVITKKANVVDNVNKILNQKEIRIKQRERQKDELLAFGKKPPK